MSAPRTAVEYDPDDYNRHDALRLPVWLWLAMVFLNKQLILFIVPHLPRMKVGHDLDFLQNIAFLKLDPGLLVAGLPAFAVLLVGAMKRVPDAGALPRWIWRHGRALLIVSALAELILLVLYGLGGQREVGGVLIGLAYIDVMIVVLLWRSRRAVDVFRDFPQPPAEVDDEEQDEDDAPTGPTILHATKLSIVHLGGDADLGMKRDVIVGLHASFEALGYDAIITQNFLDTRRLNVVVGLHHAQPRTRLEMREKGIEYMVYETDDLQGGGADDEAGEPLDFENDYLPALKSAKFVLSPFQDVVDHLNGLGVNTAYTRWGYVPALNDLPPRAHDLKDFDGYFVGRITARRRGMLQAMVDAGVRVKATDYPGVAAFLRNHFISRAKLILSLKRDDDTQTVDPYWIMYALQNGCCVVAERRKRDIDGYTEYGVAVDTDDLPRACLDLVNSGDYETACDDRRERLLSEPMTENLRGLV